MARSSTQDLTWILGLVTGALLWLALPLWLADDISARVSRLGTAVVAGAVVASLIGLLEMAVGPNFDRHLLLFKFGPDMMGPILRLSSTFSSANVAAMYFEIALPFAIAGLIGAVGRRLRHWMAFFAWLAAIDVLLIALLLTYSRGALLGLVAAGLAMAAAGRKAWRPRASAIWRWPALGVATNLVVLFGVFALSTSSLTLLRVSNENDRAWYQATYASTVPATMAAGESRTIPVTVENRSPLTWNAASPHTYGLGYHWLHPSWAVVRFSNTITWLSSNLRPGGRQTVQAYVTAPRVPGRYLLVWDTVWKSTTWFAPRTGIYQASPVRVIEARGQAGQPSSVGRLPPPDIAKVPTAPALDRREIWAVALTMIEGRPLFGAGPEGFRMNFNAVAPPNLATQGRKPPPHAHNLALELLADWGLIGGGLFFGLLAVLWYPILLRVSRGHVGNGWELAVIGAAAALLGHGLVDYFLNKQAIVIVLWLLCGLAATMTRIGSPGVHGTVNDPGPISGTAGPPRQS